mgnify:CR=1 FL=1
MIVRGENSQGGVAGRIGVRAALRNNETRFYPVHFLWGFVKVKLKDVGGAEEILEFVRKLGYGRIKEKVKGKSCDFNTIWNSL